MSDPHVSLDELADAEESLPDLTRAEQVRRHAAACPQCRASQEALARVRAALHTAPPLTMPPGVAYRLEQALPTTTAPPSATVVPLAARARRRRGPALAAVAAGVVVIGLAAALVVGHTRHTASTSSAASSASSSGTSTSGTKGATSHYVVHETGTTYTAASLPAGVTALVNGTATTPAPAPTGATTQSSRGHSNALAAPDTTSLARLARSPLALANCIDSVAGADSQPVAVDFARWTNGQYHAAPSLIIVVAGKPGVDIAYVTGPTCQGLDAVRDYVQVHSGG